MRGVAAGGVGGRGRASRRSWARAQFGEPVLRRHLWHITRGISCHVACSIFPYVAFVERAGGGRGQGAWQAIIITS